MPKGKAYNQKNVGTGGSSTPVSVMGSQGTTVAIKPSHYKSRPTKSIKFPSK